MCIFTCGGTGGHINPAIAVANLLRERRPETEILFVGAEDGMENKTGAHGRGISWRH